MRDFRPHREINRAYMCLSGACIGLELAFSCTIQSRRGIGTPSEKEKIRRQMSGIFLRALENGGL